jgi:hypothetical protein
LEEKYRHELKYNITYADYLILRPRLRTVLKPDCHTGPDGQYRIHSIYFDNYRDTALREKINGVRRREKWRIRWYNHDLSFLMLEKKVKVDELCLKLAAPLTREECERVLGGDIGWLADSPSELLREFYCRLQDRQLRPKVVVSYLREPYVYGPGNVRVTFDSDIRTSLYERDFFRPDRVDVSAEDHPGQMILEVKFDAYLPGVVKDLLQIGRIRQDAFSKYGACRRFG